MSSFWRKPFDWPALSAAEGNKKALMKAKKLKEKLVRAKMAAQSRKIGFPTKVARGNKINLKTGKND